MSDWTKALEQYKNVADEYLTDSVAIRHYNFFKEFLKEENLRTMEWEDIQKMGDHIHAFTSIGLARHKALGNPNHPLDHYRKSFLYLAYGDEPDTERINKFKDNPKYKIKYFGNSATSEIIGYVFADKYIFHNRRDEFALKLFDIKDNFERGDGVADRLKKSMK